MATRIVNIVPADDRVLRALNRYHYLTAKQLCQLLYKPGSLTYVQTKLKRLADAGYCQRLFLARASQYGSTPSVYTLARRGLNHLEEQGLAPARRFRPSEQTQRGYLFMSHTLAVNDFLIAAELLCQHIPQVTLQAMLHEQILKREPVYVQDQDGKKLPVIPDGWLDLRINLPAGRHGGSYQVCLSIEVDRGTEEQKKWRRKVQGLLIWSRGPYQERFHTSSLTVAVVATTGSKRMGDLLRWTETELQQPGNQDADLFRFTDLSPPEVKPEDLFLNPHWYRPFGAQAMPLLEGVSQ